MDNSRLVDVKPRISDDVEKIKSWKISDIVDPSQMKPLRLPDSVTAAKVGILLIVPSVFDIENGGLVFWLLAFLVTKILYFMRKHIYTGFQVWVLSLC